MKRKKYSNKMCKRLQSHCFLYFVWSILMLYCSCTGGTKLKLLLRQTQCNIAQSKAIIFNGECSCFSYTALQVIAAQIALIFCLVLQPKLN